MAVAHNMASLPQSVDGRRQIVVFDQQVVGLKRRNCEQADASFRQWIRQ